MAGEGLTSYNIAFPPQSPAAFLPDPNGRYVAQMYDAMCGWKTGECPKMLMSVEVLGVEISPCRSCPRWLPGVGRATTDRSVWTRNRYESGGEILKAKMILKHQV